MEIRRLTSAFISDIIIDNWSSAVWTERYSSAGDFQIKTADIAEMMALLPLGTFVSHKDTTQVMVVENYQIDEDDEGIDYLTITGRSADAVIFEQRIAADKNGNPWNRTDTAANICGFLLSPTGAFSSANVMTNANTTFLGDQIPNIAVSITAAANNGATSTQQVIPIDYTYPAVLKLLQQDGLGIRAIRGGSGVLTLEIYRGTDRRPSVVGYNSGSVTIDANRGDTAKNSYLISRKASKNVGYPLRTSATTGKNFIEVNNVSDQNRVGYANDTLLPQGLARRDLLVDDTDIDANTVGQNLPNLLLARNASALKATAATTVISAAATSAIPYKYNKDYGLGDTLAFTGKYGIKGSLVVSEYIRAQDDNGDVGYPTFAGS